MTAYKLLLHLFVVIFIGLESSVAANQSADAIGRKTSEPYKGDLAIFETRNATKTCRSGA